MGMHTYMVVSLYWSCIYTCFYTHCETRANLCVSANAVFAVTIIPALCFVSPPCIVVVEKSLNSSTVNSSNFFVLLMSSATIYIYVLRIPIVTVHKVS